MPVYGVAQIRIDDREGYGRYEAAFMPIFQKYGGELVAVDDAPKLVEGDPDITRVVILRFADEASFDRWYDSDEYQEIAKHRLASSTATLVRAKGFV